MKDDCLTADIYCLIDPRNNLVRYVGYSKNALRRLDFHLFESSLKKNTYKNNWLKSLLKDGLIPILSIIETVPYSDRNEREIYWISFYGRENLTNGTDGGLGTFGHEITQEVRQRMSEKGLGRKFSEKTRKKISDSNKNKKKSESHKRKLSEVKKGKATWNKGIPMSEETKKKDRESKIGKRIGKYKGSSSKYFGVCFHKSSGKWISSILFLEKDIYIGIFKTEIEAALAYNEYALDIYGWKAILNEIPKESILEIWN